MREVMIEAELIAAYGVDKSEELLQEIHDRLDELTENTDDSFQLDLQEKLYPYLAATQVLEKRGLLNEQMKGVLMELAKTRP